MIVKTTKDILAESFRELALQKSIRKITIKQITDNCAMAPATFYRHFHSKEDLIKWDYNNRMREIIEQACEEGKTWTQLQLEYVRFYEQNKELFVNIIQYTGGYETFTRIMTDISANQIKYYIRKVKNVTHLDSDLELYIRIYTYAATMIVCDWLFDTIEAKSEKIAVLLDNSLPLPLRKVIFNERI